MSSTSVNSLNNSTVNVATSGTTENGTKILRSGDNNFDKDSFLKILAAQLSNLDPTQNQDSSEYVAQMAQFASMEQMQNLNTTMSDSAYQQMVGKTVITNEQDDSGAYVQGYVTQVMKESGGTYLGIIIDGKQQEIAAENVIGVVKSTDTNTTANSRTALNSDFLAASALADKQQKVVIAALDDNNETVLVKGKVTGAYIDTVNSATVKIKVEVLDDEGNSTGETKTYEYGDIVRAGDLNDSDMDVELNTSTTDEGDNTDAGDESTTNNSEDNSSKVAENTITSQTVSTISSITSDEAAKENATLAKIAGV